MLTLPPKHEKAAEFSGFFIVVCWAIVVIAILGRTRKLAANF